MSTMEPTITFPYSREVIAKVPGGRVWHRLSWPGLTLCGLEGATIHPGEGGHHYEVTCLRCRKAIGLPTPRPMGARPAPKAPERHSEAARLRGHLVGIADLLERNEWSAPLCERIQAAVWIALDKSLDKGSTPGLGSGS